MGRARLAKDHLPGKMFPLGGKAFAKKGPGRDNLIFFPGTFTFRAGRLCRKQGGRRESLKDYYGGKGGRSAVHKRKIPNSLKRVGIECEEVEKAHLKTKAWKHQQGEARFRPKRKIGLG